MTESPLANAFWVHSSRAGKRATLHHRDCIYCNGGTGMKRRPAFAGGEIVWSSFRTMVEARAFLAELRQDDKGNCKVCLPAAHAAPG